jgi:hypothetical protein
MASLRFVEPIAKRIGRHKPAIRAIRLVSLLGVLCLPVSAAVPELRLAAGAVLIPSAALLVWSISLLLVGCFHPEDGWLREGGPGLRGLPPELQRMARLFFLVVAIMLAWVPVQAYFAIAG